MILNIKIEGLENLSFLSGKAKKAAKKAIKAAGNEYYKQIHKDIDRGNSFTPRTGNLQQSITIRYEGFKAIIGAHKEYAPYVEFGTKPHKIKTKNARFLSIPTNDGFLFVKEVNHPGSKPYPFMFLNLEKRLKQATDRAFEVFKQELKNG